MEYEQVVQREIYYKTESTTHRRTLLPSHMITLKFEWHYQYFNDRDHSTPFRNDDCHTLAYLKFQGRLLYDDVRQVAWNSIGDHLDDGERALFIEDVLMTEVRKYFPVDETRPPKHTSCRFEFAVWKRISFYNYNYNYNTAETEMESIDEHPGGYNYMVPAADSSLGMLERYEVDYDEGICCCICLEEDVGQAEAALRMPCSHVFHQGCIKEWLRTSHYCPMCRYQMPTK